MFDFLFRKEKRIEGKEIDLVIENLVEASRSSDECENVYYGIYLHHTGKRIGNCDLRVGMNEELYYAGNIGYRIDPPYRGHHYALQACQLIFDVARNEYDMDRLIITCSPDNTASRKTLEQLHGELLEVTLVPESHWLYKRGETIKNIYEYKL